jgi:hypothetical protein
MHSSSHTDAYIITKKHLPHCPTNVRERLSIRIQSAGVIATMKQRNIAATLTLIFVLLGLLGAAEN